MGTEHARTSPAMLTLALGCAFLAGSSLAILIVDFGAHVDGPGIGLEWSRPLGSEYGPRMIAVVAAMLVQGVLSLLAFARAGAKPFGIVTLPAVAFAGVIGGLVGVGRALPAWWKLGCDRGHAYACYAAGGLAEGGEARALDERACAGDVGSACLRIAREDPSRVAALCAERARACEGGAGATEEMPIRGRCRGLEEMCRGR